MFLPTASSTCCMPSTVPDWAEYHAAGACAGLMPRAAAPLARLLAPWT
jgi:hypothetical protein